MNVSPQIQDTMFLLLRTMFCEKAWRMRAFGFKLCVLCVFVPWWLLSLFFLWVRIARLAERKFRGSGSAFRGVFLIVG
jgi:hypothetical protein